MGKIKVEEEYEESEPVRTLVLKAGIWKLKVSVPALEELKETLETLRDRLSNLDAKMMGYMMRRMTVIAPDVDGKFKFKDAEFEETMEAFRDRLFEKMKFDPKPKQKRLTEK